MQKHPLYGHFGQSQSAWARTKPKTAPYPLRERQRLQLSENAGEFLLKWCPQVGGPVVEDILTRFLELRVLPQDVGKCVLLQNMQAGVPAKFVQTLKCNVDQPGV